MNLAISNIAWPLDYTNEVLSLLKNYEVKLLEIAPSKIADKNINIHNSAFFDYKKKIENEGFRLVAMQSLLFNRPDLQLFQSEESRQALAIHLTQMIDLAAFLGIKILVFGSPKNRQKKSLTKQAADNIAIPFFEEIGAYAGKKNTTLCVEANAKFYQCDYISTSDEAFDLVKAVNSPGFGLHLDLGNMILENENPLQQIEKLAPKTQHFHISAPELKPIHKVEAIYSIVDALKPYPFVKSIEMLLDFSRKEAALTELEKCLDIFRK